MTRLLGFSAVVTIILSTTACDAQPSRNTPRTATSDRQCTVTRITDGDTFVCGDAGRIRLIGIDAPEMNQRPFGDQARNALMTIMPMGSRIRLTFDASASDRYGRALAYAWIDSTMINEAMVKGGWAIAERFPPNVKLQTRLDAAMKAARDQKSGLWASEGFACKPADRRRRKC